MKNDALPFSDDITDCILCFLPDFETLNATIHASRGFLRVFNAHRNTIIRGMCWQVIGPLLPYALRLARFEVANEAPEPDEKVVWLMMPDVDPETDQVGVITGKEVKILFKYASDFRKLEDIFSFSYKNMSSPSSLLTLEESFCFQRAMYRVALFSQLFPLKVYKRDFAIDDSETEDVHEFQKSFLQSFNKRDLQEIYVICNFLSILVYRTTDANGIGDDTPSWVKHAIIAAGPSTILKLYEIQRNDLVALPLHGPWGSADMIDDDWYNPLNGYLHDPLSEVLEAQQAKLDLWNYPTAILDSIIGGPGRCDNCRSDFLKPHFWNRTNWSALKYGYDDFGTLRYPERFLKGRLLENETEWPFYASIFDVDNFDYAGLMHQLFEVKLNRFKKWEPEDWLCSTCVATFISDNLHHLLRRLYEEKWEKPGDPGRYNCIDGYDCKLQVTHPNHAKRYNHFFDPKRTVPPRLKDRSEHYVEALMKEWPVWGMKIWVI